MNRYPVELEIAGPFAMFSRPDSGGTPSSYPIPTQSAAKGLFESIARLNSGDAWFEPLKVEICKPAGTEGGEIRFQRYATNYGGPLRKTNQLTSNSSYQVFATVLVDVCYRIHARIQSGEREWKPGQNPRHYLKDLFERRLKQGRCHRTPCLGWSEFTASYWGSFRDGQEGRPLVTEVDQSIEIEIPSLLKSVFDRPTNGVFQPTFQQDARITKGGLSYVE
jgi:CRISPR-associated protein Cas5d